jgi:aminocarboxymuconate-semialdehyde decarboxylase
MRSIDIHAHLMPHCMLQALYRGDTWHGVSGERNAQGRLVYGLGGRRQALMPQFAWNTVQRLADMDSLGVDVQVVSTFIGYYPFPSDAQAIAACREANDEVRQMTRDFPDRFAGLSTLPLQNLQAAIDELERSVTQLGLKGAMLNDTINGHTFDAPALLPFWQAAEQLGALLFVHQGGPTVVSPRADRYHLPNTIGNLADRAVTFASLVFGGVMDTCPDLKVCLAHGGGYTCFGIGRMDRGWQVRAEARAFIQQPPSAYLSKFYYDCLTHSEAALRMLIDTVGIDRVVFGTDWPADMAIDWPVAWVLSLESLTPEEKEAILYKNLEQLLGL